MAKIKEAITFAEQAKKIDKRYKNRHNNAQEMNGYTFEMESLVKKQEAARLKELAIKSLSSYRKPTNASKYDIGGPLNNVLAQSINQLNPNVPASPLFPNPFESNLPAVNTSQAMSVGQSLASGELGNVGSYQESKGFDAPVQRVSTPPSLPTAPITKTPQVNTTTPASTPQLDVDTRNGNIYAPLIAGKGLEFAGKLAMLSGGYDKVKPQYNPNESRVESLMASRGIDTAALENNALSQQNVALQNLSDVRSPNVKRALIANIIQGTLRNLQDTKLRENEMNNAYRADYANTLNNLGQQNVAAKNYSEQLNTQSKSNYQQSIQNMLATAGNIGQGVTDLKAHKANTRLIGSFLYTKDFASGDLGDVITKAERGEEITQDDFIKLYASKGKSVQQATADWEEYRKSLFK